MAGQQIDIVANLLMKVDGAEAGINKLKNSLSKLKMPDGLENSFKKSFANLDVLFARYRSQVEKGFSTKADITNFAKTGKALDAELDRISKHFTELTGKQVDFKVNSAEITKAEQELEKLLAQRNELAKNSIKFEITGAKEGFKDIESLLTKLKEATGNTKTSQYASGALDFLKQGDLQSALALLEKASVSCKRFNDEKQKAFANETGFNMPTLLEKIIQELTGVEGKFGTVNTEVTKFEQILADLRTGQIKDAGELAKRLADDMLNAGSAIKQADGEMQDLAQSSFSMSQQLSQLQQSTQYFFGLRNMINLLKRGLKEAIATIKELDAAMTETAVVTKFDVSDMWAKLPEYTANANALGATVKDMYEATTLYYQQGLNTQQAMGIATETMKMARIGGLEAADATDKMTAALRGFNMEINETSAQRVNDVYSNLAAKTASNTEELGTAMQRTASIAASAGMSFEGTAAFLAQAIETTREPAENLGTAMKTIVARFTELKKNPLEITEVDGEEVSYNKVDTALQSIGVSLKDANGQFRALDEVFLDISERWNSLTQTQQRYIATTAAGSRQQSRFIAMMSNYDRTMQLMEYANNSAGASQEQFGKTLDSLEAKLNKFQNAWKEFLMGIMNDSWTKGIVTGATKILDVINKITDFLSGGGRLKGIKSMLSLFTAFTALKFAGRGINGLIGGLGGMLDPRVGFKGGFSNGALGGQAAKISNPIVKAIYSLIPHIDKAVTGGLQYKGYGDFRGAKRELNNQFNPLSIQTKNGLIGLNTGAGKYSLSGVQDIFSKNGINEAQQKALYASYPGLKHNMTKTLAKVLQESGADPQTTKGLIAGFKQGNYTSAQVLEKAGLVRSFSDQMKTIGEKSGQEAANAFRRAETKELVSGGLDKKIVQQGKDLGYKGKDLTNYVRGEIDKRVGTKTYATSDKAQAVLDTERELSKAEKAANAFGKVGGALSSAGMSLQMFGSQLSTVNPLLGEMVTKMGGMLSAAGAIPNMISSLIAGGPAVWAITAAVTALGAAFLYTQRQEQKIKDAAKEISDNFEKTNQETQDNIAKLKEYRSELAILSKGVDSNGNNINLSDADYQRYLEIVDDIAAINPEIVDGYNAQGHAIINNNKALEETLAKQEEIRDKALKTYLDPEKGLQKLINARNIDKNYKGVTSTIVGEDTGRWREDQGFGGTKRVKAAPMTSAVYSILGEFDKQGGLDADSINTILKGYGISLQQLQDGEQQAIDTFVKNQDQINAQISSAITDSGEEINNSLTRSFERLGEQTELFNEAIQPIYQNLSTQVANSPFFDSIAPEFREALNTGLKDLAAQDLDANEMSKAANNMAARFANLTTGSGKYADALKIVEEAQNDFATTLNETEYYADVQPAIDDLVRLKEEALREGTAYGDALAEYLENQIQRISHFTEEGSLNLTEALNTATDEIAAAEGALESFNEATQKDYSTAAEGMKSIFDKTTETFKDSYGSEIQKHAEGMGDATFWTGAEALLSGKELEKLTKGKDGYEAAEAVKKRLKDLEPILREGQEGFDAFTDRVLANADAMDKLAKAGVTYDKESGLITNIPDDQWHNVAEALGISDDLLTSMLNKGRQFADISFMNVEDARKALATSEYSIKGSSFTEGNKNLYVKEETLRAELANAGYVRKEQQDEQIEKLLAQGVKTIPAADSKDLTADKLKEYADDWGVKTLPDLIQTLNDTGDFTKEEIKAFADKLGLLGDEGRFDSLYTDIISAAENPELVKQTSELERINAQLGILVNNKTIDQAEQDHKDVRGELYGKTGGEIDSTADYFAHGQFKDENGNVRDLTSGEYEEIKKNLIAAGEEYKQQAEQARIKAVQTTGEEKKRWEALAEGYEQDYDNVQKYLDLGAKAFEENQQDIDRQIEANASKTKGREQQQEIANAWRIGNVSSVNRPQDLTDENGKRVTTLGSSKSFDIGGGQTQEIAFTPVVKLDGKGTILEDETVDAYINALIAQLQSEGKEVNLENLLKLDATGTIEGFEGIQNVIADIGPTAAVTAAQMHALEAGLDVETINAQYQSLSNTIKKVGDEADKAGQKGETTSTGNLKSSADVQSTTYEVFTAGAEGNLDAVTEKLDYLKTNYPEVYTELVAEMPQYQQLENYSEELNKLDEKPEVKNTIVADIATGNTKQIGSDLDALAAKNPNIKIDTNADAVKQKLDTVDKKADKLNTTKTLTVNVKKTGVSSITVDGHTWTISTNSGAKGINNSITSIALPTFGSAAKGRGGTIGPKNKGGLTLTGEKGFEIAWLPSENRSMILGAGGPQMVNLPADAVVYTHEQSKDIIKRQGIPAGSHADETANSSSYHKKYPSTPTGSSASKSVVKNAKKAGDKVSKTAEDTKKGIERVLVWWDNAGRRADAIQRRADANQKTYEKYLKEIQSTLQTTGTIGKGDAYLADMQKLITEQQRQYNKATKELKQLDTGKDANGKTVKANKTNYKKGEDNVVQISYDAGSGKKKKTKTAYINTAGYIKYDKNSGAYQVDQNALDKVKNESQRKAIADAVKKELDDRVSKQNKAEDEMRKAEEAIEKMGEELYNTFFKWETELTKIWNITQKIEATEARIGRAKGYSELLTSQLSTGLAKAGKDFAENSLNAFKTGIDNQRKQIEQTLESVGEKRNNLSRLLSLDDEKKTLENIQKKLSGDVIADYNIKKAEAAEAKAKAALDKAQNQTKTTTTPNKKITKISRTLKKGSKGSDVKDLQKALNQALGTNLAIDGKFGSKTQAAVKKFQKKYGLSQTGKMDKKTLAKLANVTGTKKTTKVAGDPEAIAKAQEAYDKAVELTKSIKEGDLNETEKLGYETYAEALEKGINAQARAWDFLTVQRRGDGTIDLNFNTEAFEEAKQNGEISEELGKSIQDYVKELVDSNKDLNEEYEKVTSLMNDLYGELETLQDQWVGYANDLWDMSEAETKKEIDNAKKLNDSLTKALKDLLDDVKKKLDQRRQQEDNAKTERDISQKQQRLAALRADTSGGHQVEIAQLEKEIAEAQQNYQRTLEDQLLERLQEQADIAEQQRERQIELQETIAEAVNNAALVDMWMADPATFEQEIWEAYKAQNDYDKKPQALQEDLLNKFNVMFDGLLNNQEEQAYVQEQIEELQKQKDILDVIKENVETLATNASTESVSGGEGVEEGGTQELLTQVLNKLIEDDKPKTTSTTPTATNTPAKKATNNLKYGKVSAVSGTLKKGSSGKGVKALQDALNKILGTKLAVDGKFGSKTFAAVKKFQKKYGLSQDGVVGSKTKAKFKALGYESGGLADYTGPAWLDGTPSKPELVLDATDTKNFLALRDVLSSAMKSTGSVNNSYGGDATYEININVDHLNNDYDVDKVAERVKKIIVKDSSYRNVTQVRNFR